MAISGQDGDITIAGVTAEFKEWTIDISAENLGTSNFGADWRTTIGGLKGWSATTSGFYDGTDATTAIGTDAACTFTDGDGGVYSGNAIVTKVSVKVAVDGVVEASWDLQGNGTLTLGA